MVKPSSGRPLLWGAGAAAAGAAGLVLWGLAGRRPAPVAAPSPETVLRAAVQAAPGDARPRLALIEMLLGERRAHDALDAAREARKQFPESVPVQSLLGETLLATGRLPEAVEAVRPLAKIGPQYAVQLGRYLVRAGEPQEAARVLTGAGIIPPEYALRAGQVLLDARRPEAAVPLFKAALPREPVEGRSHLGFALVSLGRYAEAVPHLEQAVAHTPSAALHFYLGTALRLSGKLDRLPEAFSHLRQAVELQPADGLLVYEQALAQVQLRDRDNARAFLERAAELSPDVPEIQRDLARIYSLTGDVAGAAMARAREARLLNDAPAAVRLLEPLYIRQPETRIGLALAEAYYEADRTPQALSLLYKLQAKEPGNSAIPEHLFRAERVVNHNLQALKALDRLAELSPEVEWIQADRADLLQRLNRIPEAERALEEAVRREPENALRHYQMGALLVAKSQRPDRMTAAEAAFRKALELQPDHLSSRYRLGLLLESSGRFKEAIPELRRALDQSPELVDALRVLGRAYASAGEREKSEDTFRLYRRLKSREEEQKRLELPISLNRGTEEDRLRVASFYLRTGDQSAAIKELETVLRRRPGDASVRQGLIGLYGVTRRFQRQWELREAAAGRKA